uniref:C2H2-type domain-containing protein n=1 Tax=Glossina pallidipes TaxID=7398 RepID=A0A1A9Z869_GLOPL
MENMLNNKTVFIRCFLCRKRNSNDRIHKSVDAALCPASKKSIKTVLMHLARCGKFELHITCGEWVCRQCYTLIADYDACLISMTRKQRNLTNLVEKAAISVDSEFEEECLEELAAMEEFNDDRFFDDVNVSDNEIAETMYEVMGSRRAKKLKSQDALLHIPVEAKPTTPSPSSPSIQRSITPVEILQCNLCAMRFQNKIRLQKHVNSAHKKFSCDLCSFSHRNEDYIMLHMNLHEGKNENQCRYCSKEFTTKISTIRHMEVHLDTKKYQCDKCGLCFSQTTVLYNHKLQHEAEEKPLRCEICNQIFKTKRTFRHHRITHRVDRPRYSCDYCGKTFTEKYTLKVHKRSTHSETESVQQQSTTTTITAQHQKQCYQLQKPQQQQSDTNENIEYSQPTPVLSQTLGNETKLSCIICDLPFLSKEHLNKHMEKEHDVILKSLTVANFSQNETRKPCHICGQMFSAHHNLEYHLEHVHDAVPSVDIEEGSFKYVLIKVSDEDNSDDSASYKTIVRGYKDCQGHSDIYERVRASCKVMGLQAEILGGGRIDRDSLAKRIKVYGQSQGYGKADHRETKKILLAKYPDYIIEIVDD